MLMAHLAADAAGFHDADLRPIGRGAEPGKDCSGIMPARLTLRIFLATTLKGEGFRLRRWAAGRCEPSSGDIASCGECEKKGGLPAMQRTREAPCGNQATQPDGRVRADALPPRQGRRCPVCRLSWPGGWPAALRRAARRVIARLCPACGCLDGACGFAGCGSGSPMRACPFCLSPPAGNGLCSRPLVRQVELARS